MELAVSFYFNPGLVPPSDGNHPPRACPDGTRLVDPTGAVAPSEGAASDHGLSGARGLPGAPLSRLGSGKSGRVKGESGGCWFWEKTSKQPFKDII